MASRHEARVPSTATFVQPVITRDQVLVATHACQRPCHAVVSGPARSNQPSRIGSRPTRPVRAETTRHPGPRRRRPRRRVSELARFVEQRVLLPRRALPAGATWCPRRSWDLPDRRAPPESPGPTGRASEADSTASRAMAKLSRSLGRRPSERSRSPTPLPDCSISSSARCRSCFPATRGRPGAGTFLFLSAARSSIHVCAR